VELREKENLIKKSIRSIEVADLLKYGRFNPDSLNLLVTLQIITKYITSGTALQGNDAGSALQFLDSIMQIIVNPRTLSASKHQALKLIAALVVKRLRPQSLIEFIRCRPDIPMDGWMYVLAEIPIVERTLSKEGAELLQRYGLEVLPILESANQLDTLEKWIPYIPGHALYQLPWFTEGLIPDPSALEDILIKCCTKPELQPKLFLISRSLIGTEDKLVGIRVLTALVQETSTCELPRDIIDSLTKIIRNSFNIDLYESVISLLEELNYLDTDVFELLVLLSSFPSGVENRYPCRNRKDLIHRQHVNEDDPNDVLKYRFFELREDVRRMIRKAKIMDELGEASVNRLKYVLMNGAYWQETESVAHAWCALCAKFPAKADSVCTMLSQLNPTTTHRAVLTSVVHVFLGFAKVISRDLLNEKVIPFVLECLGLHDTLDTVSGWYDFRSKQDNSCVGFLHYITADLQHFAGRIDVHAFGQKLVEIFPGIHGVLYDRDPFRQSRDIFVRSVASIVVINALSTDTGNPILTVLFQMICKDTRDVSNFLKPVHSSYRETLWPIVSPLIERFAYSDGFEEIVGIYASKFSIETIAKLITNGPSNRLKEWLPILPQIHASHGARFVVSISPLLMSMNMVDLLRDLPPAWFTDCLASSGVEGQWLGRINSHVPGDLVAGVCIFYMHALRTAQFRTLVLQQTVRLAASQPAYDEPLKLLCAIATESGLTREEFEENLSAGLGRKASPLPRNELETFYQAIQAGDYRKIRRFIKKNNYI
jgi:hypothetical protein